jgi:hypothetical protein
MLKGMIETHDRFFATAELSDTDKVSTMRTSYIPHTPLPHNPSPPLATMCYVLIGV